MPILKFEYYPPHPTPAGWLDPTLNEQKEGDGECGLEAELQTPSDGFPIRRSLGRSLEAAAGLVLVRCPQRLLQCWLDAQFPMGHRAAQDPLGKQPPLTGP